MCDLLTKEELIEAATLGWTLSNVYDLRLKRWMVVILPTALGHPPLFTAANAASCVIGLAKQNHLLSTKALRLVMAGPVAKPKTKPKGK